MKINKAILVLIILIIIAPLSYFGLLYFSAKAAKFSVDTIGFSDLLNIEEVLLSRQLNIELYLNVEGHGIFSVPVKTMKGQIYLEDTYMGSISTEEPFTIPASGTSTVHLTINLDLSTLSLNDIQQVIQSITSHNGEVKIGFDGYVEPIIVFFPITVPLSYNVYTLTISAAPVVTLMDWQSHSCSIGEEVSFSLTAMNSFRGSSIDGTLDLSVREDVAYGSDVNARVYSFNVQLSPGESRTFTGTFIPYKESSTRGFFLKAQWGTSVLAEQANTYPPRLSVIEGTLNLVNVFWTIDGSTVTSCKFGDEVVAHVIVKAANAAINDIIRVKIRKDLSLMLDEDVKIAEFDISLNKDESSEYILAFTPPEASGGSLRGYFVEIEGDLSWTMPNTYPPRLTVNAGGTPSIVNVWWKTSSGIVTEAFVGETVQSYVRIKVIGGDAQGIITLRVRKDIPNFIDVDLTTQSYTISLSENQETELTISFTASEISSSSFRGYFIQVDFVSWGTSWTMESAYPPRLKVKEQTSQGSPSLENVWWTINNQIVTQANQGQTVTAHVQLYATGGLVQGTVTIHIRKDLVLLPDEDLTLQVFTLDLAEGQTADLTIIFTASEKSSLTFRGYFIQVDFNSWGSSWTMESAYPPRLTVI